VERFRELLLRERLPDRDLDPERLLELERDWPELCSPEVEPELVLELEPLPWCPIGSDTASIWVTISVVALASAFELRVEVDLPFSAIRPPRLALPVPCPAIGDLKTAFVDRPARASVAPTAMSASSTEIQRKATSAGNDVVDSTAFEVFARVGFVARGLVYALLGFLTIELATGHSGTPANQKGAFETVKHQPFGSVLLVLLAIGLAAYAAWAFFRAALGHGPEGTDSTFDRVARTASGIVYLALAVLALDLLARGSGTTSSSPKHAAGGVLGWPGGQVLVGLAGAVLVGVALYQGYKGVSRNFLDDSKTEQMSPEMRSWFTIVGVVGYLARAAVLGLIGVLVIKAAIDYNPKDAVGLDGALGKLAHAPYGPWLLGAVAFGFFAFGIFSLSEARYRRI
jgi:hypothetical protein